MRQLVIISGAALLLSGCNSGGNGIDGQHRNMKSMMMEATQAPPPPPKIMISAADAADPAKPIASDAQIAYTYTYGYTLTDQSIAPVQAAHMKLCDSLGKTHCQIAKMEHESRDGETATASLTLKVDAALAKTFEAQLDKAVGDAGGSNSSRSIEAEDLTKDMTDTGAKIKAKQALADRLLGIIQHHGGDVGDLVSAERAFSDAQEELDAARTSMAQMRGRVAMSDVKISYQSTSPAGSGFWQPVREALTSVGEMLGKSIAALLSVIILVLPWALAIWAMLWLKRRLGWSTGIRWPWRRRVAPGPTA